MLEKIEIVKPMEIEKRSMEIITKELQGRTWPEPEFSVVKRCIHTSADFVYADTLCFSERAVQAGIDALNAGASIVTDTKMAASGISKKRMAECGGEVYCFMSDPDVARAAKERGCTRAAVCMEKAAELKETLIIAVGNAPTALIRLYELIQEGRIRPALIIGAPVGVHEFFKLIGRYASHVRNVFVVGGGRISFYLAAILEHMNMHVKIVEQNEARCLELSELLPKATIIHGNATQHELLEEEEIEKADAFVALTGMDEENIIMSMYAKMRGVSKIVTKVNDEGLENMVEQLGMESVVSAKNVTANLITGYVRAMKNSMGSANVETVYKLVGGKIEALGFVIREKTRYTGIPLKDLTLKENHLVACIVRKNQIIIPGGNDTLEAGDNVIVVSMAQGLEDLKDILR